MKKVSKLLSMAITACIIAAILSGCGQKQAAVETQKAEGKFPVTITDVYGSKVTLDKEPQRIVALAPSTVEILYKLGLGDKIVGVTDYCDYPSEALEKPKVGSFNGLNMEKIIEAKPDIVLAGAGISKQEFQRLTDLKLNVIVTEARELSQIPETIMMVGEATGTSEKAKAMADDITGKIDEIKSKVEKANKVKAYFVLSFGKEGNWTAGKGTFLSDLISAAGGENVSDDVDGWKEYSIEKLVEKNPDVILLSGMISNGTNKALDNENGYKDLEAVKSGKVFILEDNLVQRPGPRIVEGLELIAKALHPEIFK